jgi:hypothetical protein
MSRTGAPRRVSGRNIRGPSVPAARQDKTARPCGTAPLIGLRSPPLNQFQPIARDLVFCSRCCFIPTLRRRKNEMPNGQYCPNAASTSEAAFLLSGQAKKERSGKTSPIWWRSPRLGNALLSFWISKNIFCEYIKLSDWIIWRIINSLCT